MDAIGTSFCIQGTLVLDGILKRDLLMERRIPFELTHGGRSDNGIPNSLAVGLTL